MVIPSLLIGFGGFLGAIARFVICRKLNSPFFAVPYGTLFVNLLGAFFFGLIVGVPLAKPWILFVGMGFMGAFTTFSTLKWECIQLTQKQQMTRFWLYLGLSYTGGILFAFVGYLIGQKIFG